MSDWLTNSNGNYVYWLGHSDCMTVYERDDGQWSGVYDEQFTPQVFDDPDDAMEYMEQAVLFDNLEMLVRRVNSKGLRKTRAGG